MTEEIRNLETELNTAEIDLFNASTEYKQLVQDAATKRAAYDVAYATELLKLKADESLKATVPEKDALTLKVVKKQFTQCRIAEAMADGSKRHLGALEAILSSIQTRARLLNTEAFVAGRQA